MINNIQNRKILAFLRADNRLMTSMGTLAKHHPIF